MGCALPVWLSGLLESPSDILCLSGILSLGVGDSLASLVGKAIGKTKWHKSKKSVEGTIAFVVGLYMSFLLVGFEQDKLKVFVVCLLTGK